MNTGCKQTSITVIKLYIYIYIYITWGWHTWLMIRKTRLTSSMWIIAIQAADISHSQFTGQLLSTYINMHSSKLSVIYKMLLRDNWYNILSNWALFSFLFWKFWSQLFKQTTSIHCVYMWIYLCEYVCVCVCVCVCV